MNPKMKKVKERLRKTLLDSREELKQHGLFVLPDLSGPEGNAYFLLGRADRVMSELGTPERLRDEFRAKARSGDYQILLSTIEEYFTVVVPQTTYVPLTGSLLTHAAASVEDEEEATLGEAAEGAADRWADVKREEPEE